MFINNETKAYTKLVASHLRKQHYIIKQTTSTYIIAEKDALRYVIVCSSTADEKTVRKACKYRDDFWCEIGVVASNGSYSSRVKHLARKLNITLWVIN